MKFKKSQSGRSMVEMLGVLAIIGVLSVGGIAGYSLSMRRHRANQILDIASKYALVTYGSCQQALMENKISSFEDCYQQYNWPTYERSGIGEWPTGIDSQIGIYDFKTDPNTGVDTVVVNIRFLDAKLCQAVASIAGTECGEYQEVRIPIKQN